MANMVMRHLLGYRCNLYIGIEYQLKVDVIRRSGEILDSWPSGLCGGY